MKKIISIITSLFFLSTFAAKAEYGVGISGALHMMDASGTETTRESGEKNSGGISEDVGVPELFIETIGDNGVTFGLSYIPTRSVGTKSRVDAESPGDTDSDDGTYKAEAELDNVFAAYVDLPMTEAFGASVYAKLGIQHVTLVTLESLNSGATYPNQDLFGYTIGLGMKGDLPYGNTYYKAELAYTDFESYEADGAGNTVKADLEDIAARVSIGYKF